MMTTLHGPSVGSLLFLGEIKSMAQMMFPMSQQYKVVTVLHSSTGMNITYQSFHLLMKKNCKPVPEPQVFFSYPSFILDYIEVKDYESDLFKRFAKIEVGPSMEFIGQEMSQQMYRNIQDGVADGAKKVDDVFILAITVDGWTLPLRSKILHRNYLERTANRDLYTPDPEEAMFYDGLKDIDGDDLDSINNYTLTLLPDQIPPVVEEYSGFWSITVYLGPGWPYGSLVHNPIDRYLINGMTTPGLVYDANGALTLYIQKTRPDTDAKAANWLPTPDPEFGGEFHLTLRQYVPEDLEYFPPGIVKAS